MSAAAAPEPRRAARCRRQLDRWMSKQTARQTASCRRRLAPRQRQSKAQVETAAVEAKQRKKRNELNKQTPSRQLTQEEVSSRRIRSYWRERLWAECGRSYGSCRTSRRRTRRARPAAGKLERACTKALSVSARYRAQSLSLSARADPRRALLTKQVNHSRRCSSCVYDRSPRLRGARARVRSAAKSFESAAPSGRAVDAARSALCAVRASE